MMDMTEKLERFARAAAVHATTETADSWNALIEAWDELHVSEQRELLEGSK